ncbi:hypothetical protein [Chelativorans sp. AA-79]|uniref:hypothetical protein n=1 Tax=Chelativorans sp. AA-79 TaxID=3028735 RepID=UPI0023F7F752|nr:hypothetical protein [Chelativorans sp. AA-79]WEX09054.1 hypothetical protein PVE73_23910 [Chelativorans sp. AA-79]
MGKGYPACLIFPATLLFPSAAPAHYTLPIEPIAPTLATECHEINAQFMAVRDQIAEVADTKEDQARQHANDRRFGISETLYKEAGLLQEEALKILMEASRARVRCLRQVRAYQISQSDHQEIERTQDMTGGLPADLGDRTLEAVDAPLQRYEKTGSASAEAAQGMKTLRKSAGVVDRMERIAARGGIFSGVDADIGSGLFGTSSAWEAARAFGVRASLSVMKGLHASALVHLGSSQRFSSGQTLGSGVEELLRHARQEEAAMLRGGAFRYDMDDVIRKASRDPDLLSTLQDSLIAAEDLISSRGNASEIAMRPPPTRKAATKEPATREAAPKEAAATRAAPKRSRQVRQSAPAPRADARPRERRAPNRCEQLLAQIAKFERLHEAYRAQGFGSLVEWGLRTKRAEYNGGC